MPPSASSPSTRGRVLLVDDEESIRLSLGELLRRRGYAVVTAPSGTEALRLLQESPHEVLLADIHMPGNVDLELVETVHRAIPGLPAVLLTGRPSVDTAARSVRLNVKAYLTKPPDLAELCQVLDEAIGEFRALRAVRDHRERLRRWDDDLAQIERLLASGGGQAEAEAQQGFLLVSLRQMLLMLGDFERSVRAFESSRADALHTIDHLAALRRTVQVLEKTKRNFKSKDLAELRKSLEVLLEQS